MHPLSDGLCHPRGNGKRTGRLRHGQHLPARCGVREERGDRAGAHRDEHRPRARRRAPVVAAKTVPDVPKGKIFAVMDAVRALEVKAPVHIGDILCENIADTGSNLVAAADLDAE